MRITSTLKPIKDLIWKQNFDTPTAKAMGFPDGFDKNLLFVKMFDILLSTKGGLSCQNWTG